MKFVQFTENNDHEGESWSFWLQLDGNEVELNKLKDFLSENELEEGFELDMNPVDESEVDILVKHSRGGYMSDHNKVDGVFTFPTLPENQDEDWAWEFANDEFYKGDIERHFEEA